jgi:hypothetical protein
VLTLGSADAAAHLKKCSLCKVGENKAGASGAVCTADEYTADKGCQDCLLAGGKPTDKTWCKNWAEPVQACADCVATEGSTWCESVMGSASCAKKGVTNTCDKKDGKNVPAATTLASCPRTKKDAPKCFAKGEAGWCADSTYPKVESFGQCPKDAGRAAEPAKDCKDCVQEPDPDCVKCDFAGGKTWCWDVMGSPTCAAASGNTCTQLQGQNVPAVTELSGCPSTDTTKPYLWCADQSCKTSCTGTSIDKANKAKCTAKTQVSKPYKYCAATKKCGHDTATTTFACTGDVVDASNIDLTKCPRATGSKIATGATKETCGKTNTYSNGKWEAAKKCTSIESELLPQTTADCAAFGKGLTGCCAPKAPKKNGTKPNSDIKNNKNGTKASYGSMVHPSVGAGIGAGIMALVAGLV